MLNAKLLRQFIAVAEGRTALRPRRAACGDHEVAARSQAHDPAAGEGAARALAACSCAPKLLGVADAGRPRVPGKDKPARSIAGYERIAVERAQHAAARRDRPVVAIRRSDSSAAHGYGFMPS